MESAVETKPEAAAPQGIGGWLYLPLLGLIIAPIRLIHAFATDFWPLFSDAKAWAILTDPASEHYHVLWKPFLIFELTANSLVLVMGLAVLWLFLRKSRHTPKLLITWLLISTVIVATDYFMTDAIPAVAASGDAESLKEMVRGIVGTAIWVPYFLVSKRVKATFIE
jgi:hypothetical protein